MAGIYIHIPFCRQACNYCNFHFATSLRNKNEMLAALLKEVSLTREQFPSIANEPIETIYFGGGTPSLLEPGEINSLVDKINEQFTIVPGAEVTLEANPDDMSAKQLEAWRSTGINRLSIGVQSFSNQDLQWMNRAHNAEEAYACLENAVALFDNLSMDLIYGIPGLSDERWKQHVDTAIELSIPHLSCYALTVEPKTPLQKQINQHLSADTDPAQQSRQFLLLMQWLREAGYEHYEISNFAKPGFRSRHNTSYWLGKKYLGLGPSAHSYDGQKRWWNIANNSKYISSISNNELPIEEELLTRDQRINEYIMISLRTIEGINLQRFDNSDWSFYRPILEKLAERYIEQGLLKEEGNYLRLTDEGKLLADGIAAELFV